MKLRHRRRRRRDLDRDALARVLSDSEQITADVQEIAAQLADFTTALSALTRLGDVADG